MRPEPPQIRLKERFLYETVCDTTLLVVFLVLAILLAVQGFSWLDNRRKLDMYLSVPIPSSAVMR